MIFSQKDSDRVIAFVKRSAKARDWLSFEGEIEVLKSELIARYGEEEYSKALTECRILADKNKQI